MSRKCARSSPATALPAISARPIKFRGKAYDDRASQLSRRLSHGYASSTCTPQRSKSLTGCVRSTTGTPILCDATAKSKSLSLTRQGVEPSESSDSSRRVSGCGAADRANSLRSSSAFTSPTSNGGRAIAASRSAGSCIATATRWRWAAFIDFRSTNLGSSLQFPQHRETG